ncbi:hypothetical protein KAU11_11710 [Candidatus Babeliales bacterium]|nr:hypothetical protein [Candidatus Babeliales bacterium]
MSGIGNEFQEVQDSEDGGDLKDIERKIQEQVQSMATWALGLNMGRLDNPSH